MPTPTHTYARTIIPSPTPTHTYARTIIPTPTPTHTPFHTIIPSPTPTHTYTHTIIPTPTPTHNSTHTIIPTPTSRRMGESDCLIPTKMGMKKNGGNDTIYINNVYFCTVDPISGDDINAK